ncbi:bifunctional diaminohydroxyphosphoribosylaminopyrimidine deaminase/5-amino-6-(5-phosphoribosylamino)uracil reductase RibD [Urechidicola sp. KH5]
MKIHEKYISRCLELAKNGLGTTRPNPMVGCVIVVDDKIVGEGFTSPYGGPHAEVNAIDSVSNKELLTKAILYVSLEPCSHFGKTPPCSDYIIKHQIPKVVIGVIDDNSLVSGKGIERLKDNGVEVITGILEKECEAINKRFFTFHNKKRPYIVLKWAQTNDGFIDRLRKEGEPIEPTWISNRYSQQLVHQWRSEEQSIMVGTNTVLKDNPRLNVRSWQGENPVRIVLDNSLRIPKNAHVFDGTIKTIVFTSSRIGFPIENSNVEVAVIDYSKEVAEQVCTYLYEKDIQSILIEGGAKTIQSFINANLWDEARVFIGISRFLKGVPAPRIQNHSFSAENVGSDVLVYYSNNN